MIQIKNYNVVPCDVDSTLILHIPPNEYHKHETVEIFDPVEKRMMTVGVHLPMVRLLKEEAHRGAFIIVWSRGGHEWAANVIDALGLNKQVNLVLTKPLLYLDDCDVSDWLKYRVYLEPNTVYKTAGNSAKGEK